MEAKNMVNDLTVWIIFTIATILFYCEIENTINLKKRVLQKEYVKKLDKLKSISTVFWSLGSFNVIVWCIVVIIQNHFNNNQIVLIVEFLAKGLFFLSLASAVCYALYCIAYIFNN
jgi:hypothetical protein